MEITFRLPAVLTRRSGGRSTVVLTVAEDATVADALHVLAKQHPTVERSIRDETGQLRPHINIFVDAVGLRDLGGLEHHLPPGAEILILPAVSGGS